MKSSQRAFTASRAVRSFVRDAPKDSTPSVGLTRRRSRMNGNLLVPLILVGALAGPVPGQEKRPSTNANASAAFTPEQLVERTLRRRAVEAVIWAMPAVNAELMFQAMAKANA